MRGSPVRYLSVGVLVAVALVLGGAPEGTRADLLSRGPEFRVNSTTVESEHFPSVAMAADGRFVVAWRSGWLVDDGLDGDDGGIYLQRFAADGSPLGGEVQVNTTTAGDQEEPSVAIADNGQVVVVWQSHDGDMEGVYAQRYAADGTPAGGEFRVNTTTRYAQEHPVVAMAADGQFTIVWTSRAQDGDRGGIYAKRYAADGTALTGEFRVNPTTARDQRRPAIAMAPDGRLVVAWQHLRSHATESDDVYARRYGSDGTPIGSEFRVGSGLIDINSRLSTSIAADGRIVVAWTEDDDVFARPYAADGAPAGNETRVNVRTTS